ncbi:hypothetical protein PV326_008850 [Microctonus aethiopoides]|nr:hypothetical protein PV326_008850 [Microctonus aethiopoides]
MECPYASAIHELKAPDNACCFDGKNMSYIIMNGELSNTGEVWAHQFNEGGTYEEKIAWICSSTLENFKSAVDAGMIVDDTDSTKQALSAKENLLIIDSWTGHCPDAVKSVKPPDEEVEVMIIPKGTTGNIQPLDVFGFRVWKNFVKHISDNVILHAQGGTEDEFKASNMDDG